MSAAAEKAIFKSICALLLAAALAGTSGCGRSPEMTVASYLQSGKESLQRLDYRRAIVQLRNAERLSPDDSEVHYQLGLAYLGTGDARRADLYLRRAASRKHPAAQTKLAELQVRFGSNRAALENAEALAEEALKSTGAVDALDVLAWAELRLGKAEDAEQHIRQALTRFPARLQSSVLLAAAKLSRKDLAGAESVLKQAVGQAQDSPEPHNALASFYLMNGRKDEAASEFEQALHLDPKHARALTYLAALRSHQGRWDDAERIYRRLSDLPEKQYKPFHALFLLQTGKIDQALAELDALSKADPKDVQARSRVIAALVSAGRLGEADRKLAAILKANPNDVDALYQKGALLMRQGNYAEAEQFLTKVTQKRPEMASAHLALARACGAQGNTPAQRRALEQALRLDPTLLAARLDLARTFLQENNGKTALTVLDRSPRLQRDNLLLRIERNWALLALQSAEANQAVRETLAVARTPEVLLQTGIVELRGNRAVPARAVLDEALQRAPEDLRALRLIIATYPANSDLAVNHVRKHAQGHPQSARLQYFLGDVLLANGRSAEARAAVTEALRLNPDFAAARVRLAQMDLSERKLDSARATLGPLLQATPIDGSVLMLMGRVEELSGNLDAALQLYRRAAELDSRNTTALNNTAYLLARTDERLPEALRFAQLAAERNSDAPAVQDTLGWVYYRMGRFANALPYFERAAAHPNSTATQKYHLAMTYFKLGKRQAGQPVLEAALKMSPELPEAAIARKLMAEASPEKVAGR